MTAWVMTLFWPVKDSNQYRVGGSQLVATMSFWKTPVSRSLSDCGSWAT